MGEAEAVEAKGDPAAEEEGGADEDGGGIRCGLIPGPKSGTWGTQFYGLRPASPVRERANPEHSSWKVLYYGVVPIYGRKRAICQTISLF